MRVGKKVGEGWILNPCFHLGKYELLKRESEKPEMAQKSHSELGKEKEDIFSPKGIRTEELPALFTPTEKYLFGRLEPGSH